MRRAVALVSFLGSVLLLLPGPLRAADGDGDVGFVGGPGFSGMFQYASGLAIQPDGKIVGGGAIAPTISDPLTVALARLDANGVLDPSFGSGGRVVTGITGVRSGAAVALQSDGSVLALAANQDVVLARFTPGGVLDSTFGSGGIATTDCGGNEREVFSGSIVVQPDDAVVVAVTSSATSACILRYLPNGSLDPAFGTGGMVLLNGRTVNAVLRQTDGGLLVAGSGIVRLLPDGTIDTGFRQTGFATVAGAVVQPDGKILAVDETFGLARFRPDGSPDKTFGIDGVATHTITGYADAYVSSSLALQPDGRIVVAGAGLVYNGPPFQGILDTIAVVRFDAEGALDTSYATGGLQEDAGGHSSAIRIQPDGKAVVAFSTVPSPLGGGGWAILRYIGFDYTCPPTPAVGCKTSIAPLAGALKLGAGTDPKKTKEQWSWQKGAVTTLADFGDPIGGDHTAICVYDESGMTPTLMRFAVLHGAGLCKGKPCWKPLGTSGLAYTDPRKTTFGIGSIKLNAGTGGKASIKLKGQGAAVSLPSLPLGLPTRVQMLTEGGACFESVFSTTGASRNDVGMFHGKSD